VSGRDLALPLGWAMVAVVSWLGGILLLAEWLRRKVQADPEIARKVVHIGTGNVILLAWGYQIPAWVGVSASVVAGGVAIASHYLPILPSVNSIHRKSWGTFFYAVSIGVLVSLFWSLHKPQYAAIGVLVMAWGDGLAALIGQRFGTHKYQIWGMQKSWEGTATMFSVSLLVSLLVLLATGESFFLSWLVASAIALIATGLEAFSKMGIDNLTVPVGSALTGFWLYQALGPILGSA